MIITYRDIEPEIRRIWWFRIRRTLFHYLCVDLSWGIRNNCASREHTHYTMTLAVREVGYNFDRTQMAEALSTTIYIHALSWVHCVLEEIIVALDNSPGLVVSNNALSAIFICISGIRLCIYGMSVCVCCLCIRMLHSVMVMLRPGHRRANGMHK